jgi:hypothetical protein
LCCVNNQENIMGTLLNQRERAPLGVNISTSSTFELGDEHRHSNLTTSVKDSMVEVKQVAAELGVSVGNVIALYDVLVRDRECNLLHRDQDVKDEQLAGFGKLLEKGIRILKEVTEG